MLQICTPCPLDQLVALLTDQPRPMKPRTANLLAKAAILQGARSESIGFYENGQLVAAVTFYPLDPEKPGEDLRELSFACRPQAARHLTGIVHHARLTRAQLANDPALRIRATVAKGHEPGRRLARLIGLSFAGERGAFELWEWTAAKEGQHGKIRARREVAVHRRRNRRHAAGA